MLRSKYQLTFEKTLPAKLATHTADRNRTQGAGAAVKSKQTHSLFPELREDKTVIGTPIEKRQGSQCTPITPAREKLRQENSKNS